MRGSLIEIAGPENLVLDDQGHDARLELCHESVVLGNCFDFPFLAAQVEILPPATVLMAIDRVFKR